MPTLGQAFFARMPQSILIVSQETGLMAISPEGKEGLYYTFHDGSVLSKISSITPCLDGLYLSILKKEQRDLRRLAYPNL
jgi:hypothetical protein